MLRFKKIRYYSDLFALLNDFYEAKVSFILYAYLILKLCLSFFIVHYNTENFITDYFFTYLIILFYLKIHYKCKYLFKITIIIIKNFLTQKTDEHMINSYVKIINTWN